MPEHCGSLVPWPSIKTPSGPSTVVNIPHYLSLSSASLFALFFLPTQPPMKTRAKNASKHPAAPDMTPAQLAAAGIPQPKRPQKKPTKDQRIATLEEDLRMARELLQMVSEFHPLSTLLLRPHLFKILKIHRIVLLGQSAASRLHQGHRTPCVTRIRQPTTMMTTTTSTALQQPVVTKGTARNQLAGPGILFY